MKTKTVFPLIIIIVFGVFLVSVVNASCLELKYDDGQDNTIIAGGPNSQLGVKFSLPYNWRRAVLVRARFYIVLHETSDFIIHVYGSNGNDLVQPFTVGASSLGWFDVPLNVLVSSDFIIVIEYIYDEAPRLGGDTSSSQGRSYFRTSSNNPWGDSLSTNVMIRAVVCEPAVGGELLPRNVSAIGTCFITVISIIGISTGLALKKRKII